MVARLNGVQEAAGSTPVTRTRKSRPSQTGWIFCISAQQDENLRPLGRVSAVQTAAGHADRLRRHGRRFDSCHSDQKIQTVRDGLGFLHFGVVGREPAASWAHKRRGNRRRPCRPLAAAWPQVRLLSLGPNKHGGFDTKPSCFFCIG